ncbi:MAG: hypothetical protein ACXVDE_05350 [Tumebacillaceae bacterium]
MLKNRWFLLAASIAELVIITLLYRSYRGIEDKILMVQGQFPYRYADLHQSWLQTAGGLVLASILLPVTIYTLVRNWKHR